MEEREAIRRTVLERLPGARVLLYGSRTDDSKRGGDIDLLILHPEGRTLRAVADIRWKLWELIGEQKIDILIEDERQLSPFARMILHTAIPV